MNCWISLIVILCIHQTDSSTVDARLNELFIENQRLSAVTASLMQTFLTLETKSSSIVETKNVFLELETATAFPKILCEEFMHGALTECRDAHVECIQRTYTTQEEQKTARSIRRAALDATDLEDVKAQDEKNLQPQDMSPLQRKINFAKAFDVPTIPFADAKLGVKIKETAHVTEIPSVEDESDADQNGEASGAAAVATKDIKQESSQLRKG